MSETKLCNKCGRKLPLTTDYFQKDNSRRDGYKYSCKECLGFKFTRKLKSKQGYKRCPRCERDFPATTQYFYKNAHGSNGLHSICKECKDSNSRLYYSKNKKHYEKHRMRWLLENPDYYTDYYNKNKKKILKQGQLWYEQNKEKHHALMKKHRYNNKEKNLFYVKKRMAIKINLPATLSGKQWQKIKNDFNNKCAYCGEELFLEQEHFIPVSKGGEYTHNNIIPACRRCNGSKNNKLFFEWYPEYRYYDKNRENFILKYLGYTEETQQLSIL